MFMISRKQLFGCGIALTMLGNVFCAVQAPKKVDKQVEDVVAQAKVALTATSNIPFKNIVTKNQQQYRLSDDAQANARTIAALPQPLLTMVANVFAAKVVAYFIQEFNKKFLEKNNILENINSSDDIKGALVSHIREGLNGLRQDSAKFLAYDKLETAQCTISLDNNNTFTFTIEQLGLHKLVSMVAKDLYAVAKFINQLIDLTQKIDINELAHMLNALNVDYDVDLGGDGVHHKTASIHQYIQDISDMLDARIQETLIACVQKAVEAIREYTGGKEKLKADLKQGFTLHTDVKDKATVLFGDGFDQDANDVWGLPAYTINQQ